MVQVTPFSGCAQLAQRLGAQMKFEVRDLYQQYQLGKESRGGKTESQKRM